MESVGEKSKDEKDERQDTNPELTDQNDQKVVEQTKDEKPEMYDVYSSDLGSSSESDEAEDETSRKELIFKKFDNCDDLVIGGMFPKDFSCQAAHWGSDKKFNLLTDESFPGGFKLETEVFYIRESNTRLPIEKKKTPSRHVFLKTMLLSQVAKDDLYHQYRGAVRFSKTWKFIQPSLKDEYMVFRVTRIESFCVISFVPEHKIMISPEGGEFTSISDNRIQVVFPPNAVNEEEEIKLKINPVDVNFLENKSSTAVQVFAITPSLSASHTQFEKLIGIQLPFQCVPGAKLDENIFKYDVFRWEQEGSLNLTDIAPVVQNDTVSFGVSSFSGYVCTARLKASKPSSTNYEVEEAMGLKKWCKILFFVGRRENKRMKIILQCVEKHRIPEICEMRNSYGFNFVMDSISSDLFLRPDRSVITVDVKGKFALPKGSGIKHPKVRFIPSAKDQFTLFQVEIKEFLGITTYGVLTLKMKETVVHEIVFYPDCQQRYERIPCSIPSKGLGFKNEKTSSKKETSDCKSETTCVKGASQERSLSDVDTVLEESNDENKQTKRKVSNFLTEKGILELTKQMTPDTIFQVCIHMDMEKAEYDSICKQYQSSAVGNLTLLQTALDHKRNDQKLECLLTALEKAGQLTLAEKMKNIWLTGKGLDTISLKD